MPPAESPPQPPDEFGSRPPIQCDACESALNNGEDRTVSFLLLDHHTVPLVGCDDHLSQFATVCGYTSEDTADLLEHRPAGGIACPSCHLAAHSPRQPVVPVQDGAVAVLGCPDHQSTVVQRFHQGLATQEQLTASLDLT